MKANTLVVFVALASVMFARPVSAGAGQGVIIGGAVAAASIESTTEVSVTGGIGYRVNRNVGFGLEVMSVPTLKPDVAMLSPSTVIASNGSAIAVAATPAATPSGTDGRATIFTTNVRIELPTITTRIIPYVTGGGGVANVKENFTVTLPSPIPGVPVVIPPLGVTQSSTDLALAFGGGASLLVAPHVSIDVDLRYVRLIGNRDLNVGRLGVGFSYRF